MRLKAVRDAGQKNIAVPIIVGSDPAPDGGDRPVFVELVAGARTYEQVQLRDVVPGRCVEPKIRSRANPNGKSVIEEPPAKPYLCHGTVTRDWTSLQKPPYGPVKVASQAAPVLDTSRA